MKPSTLIFDFDGTLHDSMFIYRRALTEGYRWLVEQGQAPDRELAEAEMEANIGLTVQEAWARMCPDVPWSVSCHAAARVGQIMDGCIRDGTARLFPGTVEMLDAVRRAGHALVFLSNCRNEYCEAARCTFGLDAWFDAYYTAEQFDEAPKEEIFLTICQEVPGPYIAIGDRHKDLTLARVHDLPSIGCTYGYGTPEELADATCLAGSPADIPALVERIDSMRG